MDTFRLNHPFLKKLIPSDMAAIDQQLRAWGLNSETFETKLDEWFHNFESESDQRLALKLFFHLDYYNEARFEQRIANAIHSIQRTLTSANLTWNDVLLVVPDDHGDSAEHHAYPVHKVWQLPREQIVSPEKFTRTSPRGKALIFFNDTHGSGNQFFRDIWDKYEIAHCGSTLNIVVGANIAAPAMQRFRETPGLIVWPNNAAPSVREMHAFTSDEVHRLEELGREIYPKHPLGFSGTGLLVAYSFQCPNNTLPIIWANGTNNGSDDLNEYSWNPLFEYRPKISTEARPIRSIGNTDNEASIQRYLQGFLNSLDKGLAETIILPVGETPGAIAQPEFISNFQVSPLHQKSDTFTEQSPITTTYHSFVTAFEELGGRVLLLGAPGAGKTTTLLQFARAATQARLTDPSKPIPVWMSIQQWDHKTLLHDWCRNQMTILNRVLSSSQPLLYIFDGLDELGGERPTKPSQTNNEKSDSEKYDPRTLFLQAVRDQLTDAQIVISCREQDYQSMSEKAELGGAVKLLPLEETYIEQFLLHRNQPNLWHSVRADPTLLNLAQTPLLLALLSSAIGRTDQALDLNDGNITAKTVFDFYIDKRYEHESSKRNLTFDLATIRTYLEQLAASRFLTGSGKVGTMLYFTPEIEAIVGEKWKEFLNVAISLNYLRRVTEYAVHFIHLKFRDHCALPLLLDALDQRGKRWKAIEALAEIDAKSSISSILATLRVDENNMIEMTQFTIEKMVDQSTIPILAHALHDENILVRLSVVKALKKINCPKTLPWLSVALHDDSDTIRGIAIEALGEFNDSSMLPDILIALGDVNERIRWSAAKAFGHLTASDVTPILLTRMSSDDSNIRSGAAEALGQVKKTTAISALLDALQDEVSIVRSSAARALGDIGDQTVIPALLHALQDTDRNVQIRVILALGTLKSSVVVSELLPRLNDKDENIRSITVWALGEIKDPAAVPALISKLYAEDEIDWNIINALESINAPEGIHAIAKLILSEVILAELDTDEDDTFNFYKSDLFEILGTLQGPETLQVIIDALHSEDDFVRPLAVEALGYMGLDAVPALLEALHDEDERVRAGAAVALGNRMDSNVTAALLEALRDEVEFVRESVVEALGYVLDPMDPSVIPGLVKALQDKSEFVRCNAAEALSETKIPTALPALITALNDTSEIVRSSAVKALGYHGTAANVPALLVLLHSDSIRVRRNVVTALGEIKAPIALPYLLASLRNEDEDIRQLTVRALEKFPAVKELYSY
jgi:HEAT repeat protein